MTQLLQEYVDSRGVAVSIDREGGILRGVKLIGLESRNGRRYRESALAGAAAMYEEAKVNVNHPKEGPLAPRDYQDRLGVIRGVKLRNGEGLFGDLHFNPKHVLAEQLLWDAEHNPHNVGFSHSVLARLAREGEISVVEEITQVQSVDLVADPATTRGLFEQTTDGEANTTKSRQQWDALTLEVLRLHRPDLLAEIQAMEAEQLRRQLEEVESQAIVLKRKQRVFELLWEHQLSVSDGRSAAAKSPRMVSESFVELLMNVSDEEDLEALVTERAELADAAAVKESPATCFGRPTSRAQTLFIDREQTSLATAAEFAATLKSTLN